MLASFAIMMHLYAFKNRLLRIESDDSEEDQPRDNSTEGSNSTSSFSSIACLLACLDAYPLHLSASAVEYQDHPHDASREHREGQVRALPFLRRATHLGRTGTRQVCRVYVLVLLSLFRKVASSNVCCKRAMYKGYWLLNLWYGGRLVIDKEVPADELQTLLEVRFRFFFLMWIASQTEACTRAGRDGHPRLDEHGHAAAGGV